MDQKKRETNSSELLISIKDKAGYQTYLGLVDTGTSESLQNKKFSQWEDKAKRDTRWETQAGCFSTTHLTRIPDLCLPQFTTHRDIEATFHMFHPMASCRYDVILSREFLQKAGIDIKKTAHKSMNGMV